MTPQNQPRRTSPDDALAKLNDLMGVFDGIEPWKGEVRTRTSGSLVADRQGSTKAYALLSLQDRGTLFIGPGVEVYEGMIIGENPRPDDMNVNPTREKKQTNMRAAAADQTEKLTPPRSLSLEQALELLLPDECLEVTPLAVRLRKVTLQAHLRARQQDGCAGAGPARTPASGHRHVRFIGVPGACGSAPARRS